MISTAQNGILQDTFSGGCLCCLVIYNVLKMTLTHCKVSDLDLHFTDEYFKMLKIQVHIDAFH